MLTNHRIQQLLVMLLAVLIVAVLCRCWRWWWSGSIGGGGGAGDDRIREVVVGVLVLKEVVMAVVVWRCSDGVDGIDFGSVVYGGSGGLGVNVCAGGGGGDGGGDTWPWWWW